MFKLIRLFLLTSLLSALIIIAVIVHSRQSEIKRLIDYAENQNVKLAQSFSNTIWPHFSAYAALASTFHVKELQRRLETSEIRDALRVVTANLPVIKVKIYNLEGLTVYSTDPTEIGENQSDNAGFYSAARMGVPASKLTFRDTISSFEKEVHDRDLVESYLSLRSSSGVIEGVFELYTDVTPLLGAIKRSTINQVYGLVLIFGLLYGILIFTVWRADRKIKYQYQDITEKNEALQHEIYERSQIEYALKKAHDELDQRVEERTKELTIEIAERKHTEAEVRKHRTQLVKLGAVNIMGELATSLAHELNQPLTVISGCAQRCLSELRSHQVLADKFEDIVEQMAEQSYRASEIIRRVRSFIKKGEQEKEATDINETIQDLSGLLLSDASDHGADVAFELADYLPTVIANPFQLQQVVLNLVHNGIESMSESKVTNPLITIFTRVSELEGIEVSVHNKGKALEVTDMDKVFESFYTTKATGLGMGLAICRSIIEDHGGRLWVNSSSETGTSFLFTVPVRRRVKGEPSHDR
ncbi:MAG: hypothetical protein IIB69_11545 [Proteobacteria bacterium]|nr:hypothetical protein [Pseudomonadota bacterium]